MATGNKNLWVGAAVIAALGVGTWAWYRSGPNDEPARPANPPALPISPPAAASAALPEPAASTPESASSRFKVVGLMIQGNDRRVLIAVDGQPARIYRVGDAVDGNLIVKSVSDRGAVLGPRDSNDNLALDVAPDAATASTPAPVPVPPAPPKREVQRAPLADGSPQAQEALRRLGARHAPVLPQPAASTPAPAPAAPVDDGRWRPAPSQ